MTALCAGSQTVSRASFSPGHPPVGARVSRAKGTVQAPEGHHEATVPQAPPWPVTLPGSSPERSLAVNRFLAMSS